MPAPTIAGSVLVSALTGYGMDTLRHAAGGVCSPTLWEEVDVNLPYSEGELLSRVRERGTVDIGYRARDVRVRGRVAPSLAANCARRRLGGTAMAPHRELLPVPDNGTGIWIRFGCMAAFLAFIAILIYALLGGSRPPPPTFQPTPAATVELTTVPPTTTPTLIQATPTPTATASPTPPATAAAPAQTVSGPVAPTSPP